MRAQRMAVGDNYINTGSYAWGSSIDADADLVVEGNVGINTTFPAGRLHVRPGADSNLIVSNACPGGFCFTNPFGSTAEIGIFSRNDSNTDVPMNFQASEFTFVGGSVGIGTASPQAALDVSGRIKIADGTQGTGKVLTSDANGFASWQTGTTAVYGCPYSGDAWYILNTNCPDRTTIQPCFGQLSTNSQCLDAVWNEVSGILWCVRRSCSLVGYL